MDLHSNELRNSIMEEVILKNYKLLQFVENEMNKLKEENAHLKEEIAHLKEENKINKNLFCADIKDTVESTMIIGYAACKQPISWNIEKAFLIPSFIECSDLYQFIINFYSIIISVDVFKHFNKFDI